jgi:hypothetical protein
VCISASPATGPQFGFRGGLEKIGARQITVPSSRSRIPARKPLRPLRRGSRSSPRPLPLASTPAAPRLAPKYRRRRRRRHLCRRKELLCPKHAKSSEMDSRQGGAPESESRLGRMPLPSCSISGEGRPPRSTTAPPVVQGGLHPSGADLRGTGFSREGSRETRRRRRTWATTAAAEIRWMGGGLAGRELEDWAVLLLLCGRAGDDG